MFILLFIFALNLYAHPHVFVDVHLSLEKSMDGDVQLRATWYFDGLSSQGLIGDFDLNMDGKFSASEKKSALGDFEKNLTKYNYFLQLYVDNKRLPPAISNPEISLSNVKMSEKSIKGLAAFSSNQMGGETKRISYSFLITIKIKKESNIRLEFYDETAYSVLYPAGPLKVIKGTKIDDSRLVKSKCAYHFKALL